MIIIKYICSQTVDVFSLSCYLLSLLILCYCNIAVQVLEQEGQGRQKKVKYNSLLPGEDDPVSESGILVHEKRTRFSLSHDQDSIG